MPVKKEDAYRTLELLEDYYNRLSRPEDRQLRNAIEKVIDVFKSRLFQALIDIQEYYEVTLLDEDKTQQEKTVATNQVATRWDRPSTNNIILPPPVTTNTDLEEPLPPAPSTEIIVSNDLYAKPIKTGPKPQQPPAPAADSNKASADAEPPPVPPKPQTAPKPKKPPKPKEASELTEDLPPPPSNLLSAPLPLQVGVDDPDWEYEEVTLVRGSSGLGISVAGGTDCPHVAGDTSIFITKVIDGGIAAADGRLRTNDIIVSVNGTSMVNVTHEDSVQALKKAGKTVVLVIKRRRESEEMVLEIDLVKGSKGLGFSIAGGVGNQHIAGDNGIFVTKVIEGGAAHQDGRLMVGDRLIAVNDVNLENVNHETAVAALKATKQNVRLVIGRPAYSTVDGSSLFSPPLAMSPVAPSALSPKAGRGQPMDTAEDDHMQPAVAPPTKVKKKKKATASAAAAAAAEPVAEAGPSRDKRKIVLTKGSSGLGFNIVGGEDGEGIFISFILPGGSADLSGAVFKGDQLLSVNGIDLREATHEQAAAVLKGAGDRVEIVAQYKPDEYAQFDARIRDLREQLMSTTAPPAAAQPAKPAHKKSFYIRALFDYDPSDDNGDQPSPALAFRYGDVLQVKSSSGNDWWQAQSVMPEGDVIGSIPSKQRAEQIERARLKSIKSQSKKKKKKGLDRSKEDEDERVHTYEIVSKKEARYTRPIIIFGPLKDRINDDLMTDFPDQFGSCIPHTSRAPRDHEVDGRDYHFAQREQMELDIENQLFVEAGQFNGNLYGTSIQSVKEVSQQGRHCILDVGGGAIKRLQTAGIYPITILIKPASPDNIIDWLGNLSEDQARKQYDRTLKLLDDYGDQFTAILTGSSADDVYDQVKAAINEQSGPVVWAATNQPL